MTLKTRGKFGGLMNYRSSAKLTRAEFRYTMKRISITAFSSVFNYNYLEYARGYGHADGRIFPGVW